MPTLRQGNSVVQYSVLIDFQVFFFFPTKEMLPGGKTEISPLPIVLVSC